MDINASTANAILITWLQLNMKTKKSLSPEEIAETLQQIQLEHRQAKKERDALRKKIEGLTKKISGRKPLTKKK